MPDINRTSYYLMLGTNPKISNSATENSLMVYGNAMVVQNDYGHVYEGNALETSPGITRVDVREDRSGCDVVMAKDES